MPVDFSASIVTYRSDLPLLARAIASLSRAVLVAREAGLLAAAELVVVDNGPGEDRAGIERALAAFADAAGKRQLVAGHGNVGYGRANNLALARVRSDLHLVMNPDVELEPEALAVALRTLAAREGVVLLAPAVRGGDGAMQYLCKRYPSLWVLFLRGFAPAALRERFARQLAAYEMRDTIGEQFMEGIPLASGCFMLMRTPALRAAGGFDPGYFMYFEDYDLSVRLARAGTVAYEPGARIVHHGGAAARKGWRHVAWFARSAWRFFSRHGWRIA
jgi:hypothetical protein